MLNITVDNQIPEGWEIWIPENGEIPVADDNGYADHKISFWITNPVNGERKIHSVKMPSRAELGWESILTLDGNLGVGAYTVNGQPYAVSPKVKNPVEILKKEYATSPVNAVLIYHYLIALGFGGKKVQLITGLPFDQFYNRKGELNKVFLTQVKDAFESAEIEPHKLMKVEMPTFTAHRVFSESVAAFVDWATNENLETVRELKTGVAVVDIGGNTTDVSVLDEEMVVDQSKSGTEQVGIIHARNLFVELIQEKFDVPAPRMDLVEEAMRTRKLSMFGQDHDVSDLLEESFAHILEKLRMFINKCVGSERETAFLDAIIFVGGGSAALVDYLKAMYKRAHVPTDAHLGNSRGMLKRLTLTLESESNQAA